VRNHKSTATWKGTSCLFRWIKIAERKVVNLSERHERAFACVESMLARNGNVADLALIGLFEAPPEWWFARAATFIGPHAALVLDRTDWRGRKWANSATYEVDSEIIDLYGVREVVASELKQEGIGLVDVPGITNKQ
jgi:hypothetical protein